jgi:hypothetical protein
VISRHHVVQIATSRPRPSTFYARGGQPFDRGRVFGLSLPLFVLYQKFICRFIALRLTAVFLNQPASAIKP